MRQFLKSKLHNARITQADLEYEGSLGIDSELMESAGIDPYEAVEVYNITNGERLKTYAIALEPGSREISSNGAAAHKMRAGDRVIITTYHYVENLPERLPKVLIMDEGNSVKRTID